MTTVNNQSTRIADAYSPFRIFYSEDDTEEDRRKKKITTSTILFAYLGMLRTFAWPSQSFVMLCCYGVVTSLPFLLKWAITKKQRDNEIATYLLLWVPMVLLFDLVYMSEMMDPIWPTVVLIADVALLCRLPTRVNSTIIVLVTLYMILLCSERILRFGLYELLPSKKMRLLDTCFNITQEEIDATPCKINPINAISTSWTYLGIFILDYYCTMGFAVGMRNEQAKLKASVSLAENVVTSLVGFDLEEAKSQLSSEDTPLTATLSTLIENLRLYRPYLPDALFELSEQVGSRDTVKPPEGHAAIVFTDLKSSTAIWEASPDAMKRALKTHNKIIRNGISEFEGYEVKTIGDSFMVAFAEFESACKFAMSIQEKFSYASWPNDLVLPAEFQRHAWTGLMMRIGVHFGEVASDVSACSGRTDYVGRSVNKAARLEGVCAPGAVAIDSSLLHFLSIREGWSTRQISEKLKGIAEEQTDITLLFPNTLEHESSTSSVCCSWRSMSSAVSETLVDKLTLKRSATTSIFNLEMSSEGIHVQNHINTSLAKSIGCLERTDGSIVSVLASFITVGWNTSRQSSSHLQSGIRFVSLLFGLFSEGDVFVGISSSPVHCGWIGTKEQRFITVFGDCVQNCMHLCQSCADISAFALCSDFPTEVSVLRPIDRWRGSNGVKTVYQINASKLKQIIATKTPEEVVDNEDQSSEWGWSSEYTDAFTKGDWETIEEQRNPSDDVLKRVAELARTGKSLRMIF